MTSVTAARSFGFIPEPEGLHDPLCGGPNRDASEDLLAGATPLPEEALQLLRALPDFKSQDLTSSCVPHAIANAAETRLRALGNAVVEPSSIRQLYALSNQLLLAKPDDPLRDEGTYVRTCLKAAAEWGVARDKDWPFRDPKTGKQNSVTERVPPDVLQRASSWKLDEQLTIYAAGGERIKTICAAIANLEPIITAGVVDKTFRDYNGRGILPAPDETKAVGRHAVCLIGYKTNPVTKKREFLLRNSWRRWGLILQNQPSLAWVTEEWVLAQEEMYRMRISRGRRT